jgi:multisubunit Na+/H+ antiporter MnhE subunit
MAATPSPRDPSRHPGALRAWLVWWALLAALWLALVDTVVVPELVAGAVAAAIAATGAVLVRSQRKVLLRPRAAWLPAALRAIARFAPDLVPLATALWRRGIRRADERGRLVEVRYRVGAEDDPEAAAHRVLTEAVGSFAPNTIVVDVDLERGVVLAHQLVPTDDPAADATPLPEP